LVNIVLVVELRRSCTFLDAIYPEGSLCRIATEDERALFMSTKTGPLQSSVEEALTKGGCVVYLHGRLRLLESGSFQIISRNQELP
jgi:hypothetical protein